MQYVLLETDIFDPALPEKFNNAIKDDIRLFEDEKFYDFIISFHVDCNNDLLSFNNFKLPPSDIKVVRKKKNERDKIYDVLNFQLKELEKILVNNGISLQSSQIQGDNLEALNIIIIDISKTNTKTESVKDSKEKNLRITHSVMPNRPYTLGILNEFYAKRMNKLYNHFFSVIRDKKLICEILEIEETEDSNVLFRTFQKKYGELWWTTKERERELLGQLKTKCIHVVQKHIDDEKNE